MAVAQLHCELPMIVSFFNMNEQQIKRFLNGSTEIK